MNVETYAGAVVADLVADELQLSHIHMNVETCAG